MGDATLFVVVNGDNVPRKFGYNSGAGHAFLIPSGFQHDPLAWLCGQSEAATACGRMLDGTRLVDKLSGDRMCGRCCRVVTESMIVEAVADRDRGPSEGESVADMILADPDAVLVTLNSVMPDADAGVAGMPAGPERDSAVKALREGSKGPKHAANKGQGTARQSEWKSVKEITEAVQCEPDAAYVDRGDGTGTCRSCGWNGPLKEQEVVPAKKAPRVWCAGAGKVPQVGGACPGCSRADVKTNKGGVLVRHKTPGVVQSAVFETAMTAHWKHGRAPKTVVTDLELEERKAPKRAPLSESPATVDSGSHAADDMVGGVAAGMLRGRTSFTRGSDMTGAMPCERKVGRDGEERPAPTTNDGRLGYARTDVSARTDRRIVAVEMADGSEGGVRVESDVVGGEYGYLTTAQYEAKRSEPGWSSFKKSYWRKVRRARQAAERSKARKRVSREAAKRQAREVEIQAGKRIAETAVRGRRR